MRLAYHSTIIRILAVVGATLILAFLALGGLVVLISPARADSQPEPSAAPLQGAAPPASPLFTNLSLVKTATTEADPAHGLTVYNGDWITYTLTLYNSDGDTASSVNIVDTLPANTLQDVGCSPAGNCVVMTETTVITLPRGGGTIAIVKPVAISWTYDSLAASDFPLTVTFWGRVSCQSVNSQFTNGAYVVYNSGLLAFSNQVNTVVQAAPPAQNGRFSLSAAPDWCAQDQQAGPIYRASDMDWGDFDNDGDLDLALLSGGQGVLVYRNTGGHLAFFWSNNDHPAEGVRWGDFNGDGYLELLVSGEYKYQSSLLPDGGNYSYTGFNYLYRFDGNTFTSYDSFTTNDGAWRAAVADFTGDGYPDLAMISYYGGCTVHLFKNDGTDGRFNRSDPGNTTQSYCLLAPPFYNYGYGHDRSARSAAWGDYDNDGHQDLAVSHLDASNNPVIRVYRNNAGVLTETNAITVASSVGLAFDLAWGDYDGDGLLDLAAALVGNGFRVYHNDGGSFTPAFTVTTYRTEAVDWGDFDGDGQLELAVAGPNLAPRIYHYDAGAFTEIYRLQTSSRGDVYGIRGIDYDNDGDLDLAFTNYQGQSWLFSATAPFLQARAKALVGTFAANGLAWGDLNGGYSDLVYGTGNPAKVFLNGDNGNFASGITFTPNPVARSAALGDVNGDGALDVALGVNGHNLLYLNQGSGSFVTSYPDWIAGPSNNTSSLFFADVNQDNYGRPELVAGNQGAPACLYLNQAGALAATPTWQSPESDTTYQVGWGYYDGDILPDLAVANGGGPTRIYRNTGFDGFSLAQTLPVANTRSVAWGDYDGDGDMDLALGNYGQPVQVYRNDGGTLTLAWTAPVARNTTSVAWGDWNSDGRLDLAVGNYDTGDLSQLNQVYTNLGSTAGGGVNLALLWEAAEPYETTGLAWGDYDGDGDMDLAISQEEPSGPAGIYENTYVSAAHLNSVQFPKKMPLPQNPTYLSVDRPGSPDQLFKRSALADPATLIIPITFHLFDPNGTRQPLTNQPGHNVKVVGYQYSLDGGGRWYTARVTPTLGMTASLATNRQGVAYTVNWRAGEDLNANNPNQAVSEDVRFRITITRQNTPTLVNEAAGRLQQVVAGAASPPFRIRSLSCIWPEDPYILMQPTPPISAGVPIKFEGGLSEPYGGTITYTWDFGSVISPGQVMVHSYTTAGDHVVTLTVSQPPCPNTRLDFVTTTVTVAPGSGPFSNVLYLPLILKSGAGGAAAGTARAGAGIVTLDLTPQSPHQVTGLEGAVEPGEGAVLRWRPDPADDALLGYRVYRSGVDRLGFQRLAQVPAATTTYADTGAACGYAYFVTAYNARGESLPSTSSFYSPPCR
jgi:hypothetical protein